MLVELISELRAKNITFAIARLKGPIRSKIHMSKSLSRVLRSTPSFTTMGEALEGFKKYQEEEKNIEKQNN